jgi:subtilase family serine protease
LLFLSKGSASTLFAFALFNFVSYAQTASGNFIRLVGDTRPEATAANDRGRVPDDFTMSHLSLQLRRSSERQAALDRFTADLENPNSPNFHHWLTAEAFGARYGLAPEDIATIGAWLRSEGFQVNIVFPSDNLIDFSGNAGQIRHAFHTEIHRLLVKGESHIANMSDPEIPAALAPAVAGITSLHDFYPHAMNAGVRDVPLEDFGNGRYVAPGDLAIIYNLNPLYAAGISGQGQTIAVLESSDLYNLADWYAFRRVFGLTKAFPDGTIAQIQPSSDTLPCSDPGAVTADREATLDSEWVTATAPNANVVVAACANAYDPGVFIAMRNLLDAPNPPSIMSISYGNSEAAIGATENAFIYSLYQQAVAEGVSVFVSAGDWGGDGFYNDRGTPGTHGLSVSGYASTPFNVAVGGTDFEDTYMNETNLYWNTVNTPALVSAKSYVPEIPWDGSCADPLWANFYGFATSYGSNGFCNSPSVPSNNLTGLVGSGGPSSCAYGAPQVIGVVGGTCTGYLKPSWQAVLGNPNDGVRDLPDVSLFASAGAWNHGYLICYSDPSRSGSPCTATFGVSGGTSASSPVMASIQALINQQTNQSWGNPNPIYYALANSQYGSGGSTSCDSSLGNGISQACVFNDITQGDNEVICQPGTPNCFAPSGAIGVISLSTTSYVPTYPATTGWDFASGIGSVNAFNLVMNWTTGVALLAH